MTLNELLILREKDRKSESEVVQTFLKNGWKLETFDKASENKIGIAIFLQEKPELTNDDWFVLKFYFIDNQKKENQIELEFLKKEFYNSYLSQIELSDFKLIDSSNSSNSTKLFYQKESTIISLLVLKRKDENGMEFEFYEISFMGLDSYLKKKHERGNNR